MPDTIDLEDQALREALTGFSANLRTKALALIATGKIRRMAPLKPVAIWRMPSASTPGTKYVVIDDGEYGLWCPCPATGNCHHKAAAIMLRVHAEHQPVSHRPWCGASDYPDVVPTSNDVPCLPARHAERSQTPSTHSRGSDDYPAPG